MDFESYSESLVRCVKRTLRQFLFGASGHPEILINKEKKYAYLVNSKAACTTIKSSIINDLGYGSFQCDFDPHGFDFVNGERVFKKFDLSGYSVFTVVREPYARLKSLYANKFRDSDILFREGFYYQNYMGGYFKLTDSFQVFLEKVIAIPDRHADRHFVSQDYLIKKAEKLFNCKVKVYRLEEYQKFTDDMELLGLTLIRGKANNSARSSLYNHEMPSELKLKIYQKYKSDFDFLNYRA